MASTGSRLPAAADATGHTHSAPRAMMIGHRHDGPGSAHVAAARALPGTLEQAREAIRTSRAATLGIFDFEATR